MKIDWWELARHCASHCEGGSPVIFLKIIHAEGEVLVQRLIPFEGRFECPPPREFEGELGQWGEELAKISPRRPTHFFFRGIFHFYFQYVPPRENLLLFGGGHINSAIIPIALSLNYTIYLWDDRPDYSVEKFPPGIKSSSGDLALAIRDCPFNLATDIVVATRGHKFDQAVLDLLFQKPWRYLGVIGSAKKIRHNFAGLKRLNPDFDTGKIHGPIGLDIGASSSAEIAVAVMAEILAVKNGRNSGSLREKFLALNIPQSSVGFRSVV